LKKRIIVKKQWKNSPDKKKKKLSFKGKNAERSRQKEDVLILSHWRGWEGSKRNNRTVEHRFDNGWGGGRQKKRTTGGKDFKKGKSSQEVSGQGAEENG